MDSAGTWSLMQRRAPSDRVPRTKEDRSRLLGLVREHVRATRPVPPLSFQEVLDHTDAVLAASGMNKRYRDYCAVLVNNEVWKEQVAKFPFHRRLLLLPKCLRSETMCRAEIDELGLVCGSCGSCPIGDLQTQAERLGYAVMVAEGSPIVMSLIETGKVDAVVGVSCLSVLERVFPYMEAGAVPGIAIPLLNEGCSLTTVDLDWVWDAIHLLGSDPTRALDLEGLRREVEAWFAPERLEAVLGPSRSDTEKLARDWLAKAGKRWRPFLAVCTYQALQGDPGARPPDELETLAIAIECFHKASLIHDDIEDGDAARYGERTLHEELGIPVALNVGDFLIGEGYRLLTAAAYGPQVRAAMLAAVSEGHRTLCVGQGAELLWRCAPRPLSTAEVLEIFRLKTAPAFDVALQVGALAAGAGEELWGPLRRYSASVGTAYQIRDDIEDFDGEGGDLARSRPPLILAIAHDRATGRARTILDDLWRGSRRGPEIREEVAKILDGVGAFEVARELLDVHKFEAIRVLGEVGSPHLKGLLRRVISKIFGELEAMGCCDEYRAGNAASGERGADAAA